ncbi:MAG TPA: AAA family ATPase [Oligoflexia bacterium]|nr:AAA family ATPase [Oligoflexia bacterium]HMP27480.1 AAA family ATPase [Oligoflexia bacterium]
MKLLIVDSTTEQQAFCAKRIESFNQSDMEMLDLRVKLVGEKDFAERLQDADVLVLGSGLAEKAIVIARQSMSVMPWLHIIMFVSDEQYGGGAFRAAHSAGVRKVFPDSASPLDFLQELVAIHAEFRREGRTREGKLIAITHAKGGVGATSIAAALGEVCSVYNKRAILWDMDVETRDLSRSLTVNGSEARVVSAWLNGSREISRESLKDALVSVSNEVSVLMPPDRMAESMDLVCHTDSMAITQRIIELARVMSDVIIVDTAGRLGPATGTILRNADIVLFVIDDTILGLTAVDLYLTFIKTLIGSVDRLLFLVNPYSGVLLGVSQIATELEPAHNLGEAPWRLPPVPNDPKAAFWPGSGRTLYSMGQKNTRQVLESISRELGIISLNSQERIAPQADSGGGSGDGGNGGWFGKLFGRKNNSGFMASQ